MPVRLRNLADILDPQPQTAKVLHRLLDWIDRADWAAQAGASAPAFTTADGEPVFPEDDEEWWLTDFEQRKRNAAEEEESSAPETEGSGTTESAEDEDESSDEEYHVARWDVSDGEGRSSVPTKAQGSRTM